MQRLFRRLRRRLQHRSLRPAGTCPMFPPAFEPLEPRVLLSTSILSGQEITGALGINDAHVYTFTAQAGGGIRATMGESSATAFSPRLDLYSPGGVLLATDSDSSGAWFEVMAPETGVYSLTASDQGADNSGTYTLGLIAAPGTTTPGARGGGAGQR